MKAVMAQEIERTAKATMTPDDLSKEHPALSDPVSQTVEMIAAIHARAERGVDRHQRTIEHITGMLGRPGFLYLILVVVALWIVGNLAARHWGLLVWDAPPFFWLQGLVGLSALLTTIVVLITQNRMGKMAESRARLDLQMSLLVEQKVTKLIELMEELRRDLPSVQNRDDPEAEAMTEAADPDALLTAIEITLEHADAIDYLITDQETAEK